MEQTKYSRLKSDLDLVVTKLQDPDIDIDEALLLHTEASEIIKKLETYLKQAELKIKKITKS